MHFYQNVLSSLLVTGLVLVLCFSPLKQNYTKQISRDIFFTNIQFLRNYLSLETRHTDRTDIYRVQLRLDDRRQTIPIAWRNGITAIKNCVLILKKTKIASTILFLFA